MSQTPTQSAPPAIDPDKVEAFADRVLGDFGATVSTVLALVGHRLGLYRAMAGAGRLTSGQLAERTGTHERYVREWLNNQAAGGYVVYDAEHQTYELPAEHAMLLADDDSPMQLAGAFPTAAAVWGVEPTIEQAFRTGEGVGWHDQDPLLFSAVEEWFGPQYRANLVPAWIPALDGMPERLAAGGRVADVGCGHGASTIAMARAWPASTFHGFDYHEQSIEVARQRAAEAGVTDRVTFEVATANGYPGQGYDLVCFFDCLHDLGDPLGAARHTHRALAEHGSVLLVEPLAGDRVEDNFTPMGRIGYGMSTLVCVPNSLAQEVGLALGGQAGPARLRDLFEQAGFTTFRRAAESPVNLVLEARS